MNNRFVNIFESAVKILILGIWSVIMLGLFALCIVRTVDMGGKFDMYFLHDSPIRQFIYIAVLYVVMVAVSILIKNYAPDSICKWVIKNKNYIGVAVTVIISLFLIWWISITWYEPVNDQMTCFECAKAFLQGDREEWVSGYMSLFPFQNGLVFFDMLLVLLFGDNAYIAFQYINVLFFIVAVIAIYKTCRCMFKKDNSLFIWFALLLFYPFAIYVVYCYGTMIGFSFAALAVMFLFMYFDNRRLLYPALCSVSMILSIIMKPNYSIVLVGIILYLIYDVIASCLKMKKPDKRIVKKSIIGLLIVISIYFIGSKAVNSMFDAITGYHNNGIPKIAWVAMGLHGGEIPEGWWDGYTGWVYERNNRNAKATIQECVNHIDDRIAILTNEKRLIKFYYKKISSEWNNPTWEGFNIQWVKSNAPGNQIKESVQQGNNQVYKEILNICQTLINFGIILYILTKWANFKSFSVYELFNAVLMIGAFIFWTVWEAKSQYVLPYYYFIIPYAIVGWKSVVSKTVLICENAKNTLMKGK